MARVIRGRPLKGSEIRSIENSLKSESLRRKLYSGIKRGDSLASIGKIFEQAGYRLTTLQRAQYVANRYRGNTSLRYFDRIASKHGTRNLINSDALRRAGWSSDIRITIEIVQTSGVKEYRTIEYDGYNYNSLSELASDVLNDGYESYDKAAIKSTSISIASIDFI